MNNTRYHSNETLPNPRKKLINGLKSKIGEHAELDGVYIGYRNPNKNYIYYNNDVKSDRINKSVIAHEQAHSLENKASENKISQIIPQSDYKGVSNFEYESYLNDPREVHSRLMELRQHLNIDPKKV